MPWYHVYVHYDDKGTTRRKIEYGFRKGRLEQQIAIPYMSNKPFMLLGKVIHPSSITQILFFKSERPVNEYKLPNGKDVLSEEDILYIAKSFGKKIHGIRLCTSDFITAPPEEKKAEKRTPIVPINEMTKVFIVHGRDEIQALRLQKYLTRTLKLDAEVFEDFKEKSGSSTIIEQLEYIKNNIGYVFVIVTPDDVGCLRKDFEECKNKVIAGRENVDVESINKIIHKLKSRARQNVIFEHGLFIGALERDRVCCLFQDDTAEKPSDIDGILYVGFKRSVKETYPEIIEKLKSIGLITS